MAFDSECIETQFNFIVIFGFDIWIEPIWQKVARIDWMIDIAVDCGYNSNQNSQLKWYSIYPIVIYGSVDKSQRILKASIDGFN